MANKIKFGTQCDEDVLKAVKVRLPVEDLFLADAIEEGLKLWLAARSPAKLPLHPKNEVLNNPVRNLSVGDILPEYRGFFESLVRGLRAGDATIKILCTGVDHVLKDKGYGATDKTGKRSKIQPTKAG